MARKPAPQVADEFLARSIDNSLMWSAVDEVLSDIAQAAGVTPHTNLLQAKLREMMGRPENRAQKERHEDDNDIKTGDD